MKRSPGVMAAARTLLVLITLIAGCERKQPTAPEGMLPGATGDGSSTSQPGERGGNPVADAAISARVKAAILADPALKSMEINVDTVNGIVTLSGTIDTPHNLERATQVAKAVEGVKSVSNQLNVKAPT